MTVVSRMFFTEVIPLIWKKRLMKNHVRNICVRANAHICHMKLPCVPAISPTAEHAIARAICQGETHSADISNDAMGMAML